VAASSNADLRCGQEVDLHGNHVPVFYQTIKLSVQYVLFLLKKEICSGGPSHVICINIKATDN
jgi:hypothetical protein